MSDTTAEKTSFPTGDEDLDKLFLCGDPLERIICQDPGLLENILPFYARVWAKYVYPRRVGDGALLEAKWQEFGGRHYTALIRLHHALNAKKRILELCEPDVKDGDYDRLLEVHSACTAFWDNLGAAIDNFARAREEAKKAVDVGTEKRKSRNKGQDSGAEVVEEKFAARTLSQAENPKLFYAFERRHQFIHSILVPQKIEGGMIVFNLKHFNDVATDWSEDIVVYDNIDSKIESDWSEIMKEFGESWGKLYSWFQSNESPRLAGVDSAGTEVTFSHYGQQTIAGPPERSSGNPDFIPSRGTHTNTTPPSGTRYP